MTNVDLSSSRLSSAEFGDPYRIQLDAPHPDLLEIRAQVDAFAYSISGRSGTPTSETEVYRLFNEIDINGKLEEYGQNVVGVSEVVGALNTLDEVTGGEEQWGLRALLSVHNNFLLGSLRRLIVDHDPALFAVLERAVDQEPLSMTQEAPLMRFIESITRPDYGHMSDWARLGKRGQLPPFLQRLTERPYFARVCLDSERSRLQEEGELNRVQVLAARDAERTILEDILGLDEVQSKEYRLAIEKRTLKVDDIGVPLNMYKGGGLNLDAWYTTMRWYVDNYNYLGAQRVRTLREDWRIINLDRYSPVQLERMCRLSECDPELLEYLRNNDVTMLLTDCFGDSLDAAADDIYAQEDSEDTVLLFAEAGHPVDLYRPFVTLTRRFGIKASTIAVSSHGVTGGTYFGRSDLEGQLGEFFDFGVTNDPDPDVRYTNKTFFDLRDANIARFLHDYMTPGRISGERIVMLLACNQATRFKRWKVSAAETLARQTNVGDRVVVVASDTDLALDRQSGRLWDAKTDRPAMMRFIRRTGDTALTITIGEVSLPMRRAA